SYVFKLADFGTARELRADETFISLHGTEEYLYPGMYERALVNPSKRHKFFAQVDLWSVGATFFHAATGRLPFQPFRKRDDKKLMYHMISSKQPGVISGWQLEPSGDIIYSETLPSDTIISELVVNLCMNMKCGLQYLVCV
ncbi:Serine/threonine-protein kinase TBK1, partial [Geodia barretti]